jgi:hypothetical protein
MRDAPLASRCSARDRRRCPRSPRRAAEASVRRSRPCGRTPRGLPHAITRSRSALGDHDRSGHYGVSVEGGELSGRQYRRTCMDRRVRSAIIVLAVATLALAAGCGETGNAKVTVNAPVRSSIAASPTSTDLSTRSAASATGRQSSPPACDSLRCGPPPTSRPCPEHQIEPSFNGSYCGPHPTAGNGLGPSGECTGRETTPPCGPGMMVGRYYAYTLPGRCDGRLILDGRHWLSELPPPTPVPDMYVWVSIGPSDQHAGFISPNGSVGFDIDRGQPMPVCSEPPVTVHLPIPSPST